MRWNKWKTGAFIVLLLIGMAGSSYASAQREASHALPISGKVILVDAGHGGTDPGKTGSAGSDEKDLNLEIARRLQSYLEMGGASVLLTRSEDEMLSDGSQATKKGDMKIRGELIRKYHPDLFISIHQNSFRDGKYWGPQVFYREGSSQGQQLAEAIQEKLNLFTGSSRQCKSNTDYYILKQSEDTAVLVECGFLTNTAEERKLNDEGYQKKIAWSIYSGMNTFFEESESNGNTVDTDGGSTGG